MLPTNAQGVSVSFEAPPSGRVELRLDDLKVVDADSGAEIDSSWSWTLWGAFAPTETFVRLTFSSPEG
jgi:hypothetical protein